MRTAHTAVNRLVLCHNKMLLMMSRSLMHTRLLASVQIAYETHLRDYVPNTDNDKVMITIANIPIST
jgi:hypothetical protein